MVLNFKNLQDRQYGVSVKYYRNNEDIAFKRIDYDVLVNVKEGDTGWMISVNKENIFFNQHEPDTISEILSGYFTRSLYPVQTEVNNSFQNIKGIINYDDILKRWKNNKNRINDKYIGEIVESLIASADIKFSNKVLIEKSMKYDMFWNLFFHPKYMAYGSLSGIQTDLHLALVPYKFPVRFSGLQSFNAEVTPYGAVQVKFNSDEMEAPVFLLVGIKNANQKYYMKLNVVFDLDAKHYFPMHTTAYFDLYYRDTDQRVHSEKRIQFTMYQLNIVGQTNELNLVLTDSQQKNKRSKLMKFIDTLVGD